MCVMCSSRQLSPIAISFRTVWWLGGFSLGSLVLLDSCGLASPSSALSVAFLCPSRERLEEVRLLQRGTIFASLLVICLE